MKLRNLKRKKAKPVQQRTLRLAIGSPSVGLMRIETSRSLASLMFVLGHSRLITPMLINPSGMVVAEGRNQIILEAQGENMDQVLFIDTDMVFPHDAYHILNNHMQSSPDVRVVGCNYSRRDGSGVGIGMDAEGKRMPGHKEGLVKVKGLGFGLILIDMSVFDEIEKPYYCTLALPDKVDSALSNERVLSEDFYFCRKVRDSGIDVWCDTDLSASVGHVGSSAYYLGK